MLEWNVLGSCLYNGQYERHIENTSNPMQGWQKHYYYLCYMPSSVSGQDEPSLAL